MFIRPFNPETDRTACHRIWREVGWLKAGQESIMDCWVDSGRALVGEVHGEAECLVLAASGRLQHLKTDVPLSAITGVTTSYVARKQGLAARALARMVASEAEAGAAVSGLGMFEQGFYNRLGYGTTSYLHFASFDPSALQLPREPRVPYRLTKENWKEIHANRVARRRNHGAVTLEAERLTRGELEAFENGFGLGFRDEATGELSHHVYLHTEDVEHGPYRVSWMAYRTLDEFVELLGVIRNLGDQVRVVKMEEPAGLVLQDFLKQPFTRMQVGDKGKYAVGVHSLAVYQFRICDLAACIARTRLARGEARFNLALSDPIEQYLDGDSGWRGVGGEYRVTLGAEAWAERGLDSSLPTLKASVGAFTRLWLGARTASSLLITDGMTAPEGLVRELDELLRLPSPVPAWEF